MLTDVMSELGLEQLLRFPTREKDTLDVILTSLPGQFQDLVSWLVWFSRPFEIVFQSISGRLPKRGRKRRERIDEIKMSKQPHPHLLQAQ